MTPADTNVLDKSDIVQLLDKPKLENTALETDKSSVGRQKSSVLYRKYRSQSFDELMGQDIIKSGLQNALKKNLISHAYLFTGPRGTGKTSTARILAKALNCENLINYNPCNQCASCQSITTGSSMDVLEFDAASESGVDNIREHILQVTNYLPTVSRYKIFIIDEVHDLSSKAFDALLKTIEEPPQHIIFILATTEYHKVPLTIRSRCQKYNFHRATIPILVDRIRYILDKEGYTCEDSAVEAIAKASDGGFRDALNFLQQAMALSEDMTITPSIIYNQLDLIDESSLSKIIDLLVHPNTIESLTDISKEINNLYTSGKDPKTILDNLILTTTSLLESRKDIAGELIRIRCQLTDLSKPLRDVTLPSIWLEANLQKISLSLSSATEPKKVTTEHTALSTVNTEAKSKPTSENITVENNINANVSNKKTKETTSSKSDKTNINEAWNLLVKNFENISKAAHARLTKSHVDSVNDNSVTIGFSRNIDVDWVNSKPKLVQTIKEELASISGKDYSIEFIQKKNCLNNENTSEIHYEVPLTGSNLYNKIKEVFN